MKDVKWPQEEKWLKKSHNVTKLLEKNKKKDMTTKMKVMTMIVLLQTSLCFTSRLVSALPLCPTLCFGLKYCWLLLSSEINYTPYSL